MNNKIGRKFPVDFKTEAIKLVAEQGYTQSQAGKTLRINSKNSSRWIKTLSETALLKKVGSTPQQQALSKLRKENQRLRMEHALLKNLRKAMPCPEGQKLSS